MGRRIPRDTLSATLAILLSTVVLSPVAAQSNTATVEGRLAKLERTLNNRGLLDLLQTVERLQREVQRLRGQIEEQNYAARHLRRYRSAAAEPQRTVGRNAHYGCERGAAIDDGHAG